MTHSLSAANVNVEIVNEPATVCGNAIIAASTIVRVTVKPEFAQAYGIDRTTVYGIAAGKHAARVVKAVLAGRVFEPAEVKTDVNGKTYVAAVSRIYGRRLNSDLKRLGF